MAQHTLPRCRCSSCKIHLETDMRENSVPGEQASMLIQGCHGGSACLNKPDSLGELVLQQAAPRARASRALVT